MVAVDSLNLEIKEGEIFGLLEPNGACKTTTISMLSILLAPTAGTATVNGFNTLQQAMVETGGLFSTLIGLLALGLITIVAMAISIFSFKRL